MTVILLDDEFAGFIGSEIIYHKDGEITEFYNGAVIVPETQKRGIYSFCRTATTNFLSSGIDYIATTTQNPYVLSTFRGVVGEAVPVDRVPSYTEIGIGIDIAEHKNLSGYDNENFTFEKAESRTNGGIIPNLKRGRSYLLLGGIQK